MTKADKEQLQYLLVQYLEGMASPSEEERLFRWLEAEPDNSEWESIVQELIAAEPVLSGYDRAYWQPVATAILRDNASGTIQRPAVTRKIIRRRWLVAAAVILLMATAATFFWPDRSSKVTTPKELSTVQVTDIAPPATAKPVLTLSDGSHILLDSVQNGLVVTQGNSKLQKLADGQLQYTGRPEATTIVYNTITVPRGSRLVQLTLSDGSKVWLNAASSLKYPVAFSGNERRVWVTGEAYFEIAKDPHRKFIASAGGLTTEVLGTHFNINVYEDEQDYRITLLEGSVRVRDQGAANAVLRPGEQARVAKDGKIIVAQDVDLDNVMAWKNGVFDFRKATIQMVMRQVSRHYDVEVVYEGIPQGTFSGGVSRHTNVSNVLKVLELSGVRFRIEARKIIISQ